MHGYGTKVFSDGSIHEGLYEEGDYDVKSKENV